MAETTNAPIEDGVLDTVQKLKNETIRRRDRIVHPTLHRFLVVMSWVGGAAVLGWLLWFGFQLGRASSPATVAVQVPAQQSASTAQTVAPPASGGAMTIDMVKAGLAGASEVVKATDVLLGQVKAMAQAEASPVSNSVTAVKPTPTPGTASGKTDCPKPSSPCSIWDINK